MLIPETPNAGGWRERFSRINVITGSVLFIAVAFNLALLFPELTRGVVSINDSMLHLLMTDAAVEAIKDGRNFTDPWQETLNLGFPLFHYYQHLPHLLVALFHVVSFEVFPVADLIRWSTYLLLSLFPLSVFWSLRRLGFSQLTAAMGGLVAPLAATNDLFGFSYGSYTYLGFGLYSQLWAMVLFPPAIAVGYGALRDGQGYFWATLLLAALLMSHLMYGYMAFISLGFLTLIALTESSDPKTVALALWEQWRRLILLLVFVVVITSYFLLPFILDRSYVNDASTLLPAFKDSFGISVVLETFAKGDIFDFNRFPSLTILVLAGLGLCLVRWRQSKYLIPVGIFLIFLLLYFGRETWGSLIDLLPLSGFIPMHRFIAGVHLGGILLAAIALAVPLRWAVSQASPRYLVGVLATIALLLLPAYIDRESFASENRYIIEETQDAMAAEEADLDALFERIKQLPPGRVYAGPVNGVQGSWGLGNQVGFVEVFALAYAEGLDVMGTVYNSYPLSSPILRNFDESKQEHYDLFNIRYVVAPEGRTFPDFVKPLDQFGRHHLYEVETTGYFGLVDSRLELEGERAEFREAAADWIASDFLAAKRYPEVSLEGGNARSKPLTDTSNVLAETQALESPSPGSILSEEVGHSFYAAKVNVERPSTLLLKANYHPNWQATIDGTSADTVMLMPGFLGIQLPAGEHEVRLEYSPRSLKLVLLFIGLVVLALIPLVERRGEAISGWVSSGSLSGILSGIKRPRRNESRQSRRRRNRR